MGLLNLTVEYRTLERAARGAAAAGKAFLSNVTLASAAMVILQKSMQTEVPVKTGRLRDSITPRRVRTAGGLYGVAYGVFVRDGTAAHTIRPRNAKALRFVINGKTVFAKVVHHPGTRANRFDRRTVTRAEPALRVLMLENGRSIVRLMQSGG